MELTHKALFAGVLFGIWPLLVNKSGLQGNVSTTIFCALVLILVLPLGWRSYANGPAITLLPMIYMFIAGVLSAAGLLFFNDMLSKVEVAKIGNLLAMTLMMQLLVPVIYQSWSSGRIDIRQALGVLMAGGAILLLRQR